MDSARENLSSSRLSLIFLFLFLGLSYSGVASQCPSPLDCALQRRNPCPAGSQDCGPCLPGYREDGDEKCSLAGHQRHGVYGPSPGYPTLHPGFLRSFQHLRPGRCGTEGMLHSQTADAMSSPPVSDGGKPTAEGPADVDGLFHSLFTQWEKITPQMSDTPLGPGPRPTDTSQTASLSLSSSPGAHQSTKEPRATMKTTPATRPVTGRDGSKRLSRLLNDVVSLTLIIICAVTGLFGLAVAALCWYRLQKEVRLAQKMVYEGVQQPLPPSVNRRIAERLQRTHYQHQKKVLQALEENKSEVKGKQMSTESEPDNENGEYMVYECPGLASTGEMEIHNPLFDTSVLQGSTYIHQ